MLPHHANGYIDNEVPTFSFCGLAADIRSESVADGRSQNYTTYLKDVAPSSATALALLTLIVVIQYHLIEVRLSHRSVRYH